MASRDAGRRDRTQEVLISGRVLADRELGAALTHRLAYETALRADPSWALIVEDDLRVLPASEEAVLRCLTRSVEEPAIVNLQPGGGARRLCPQGATSRSNLPGGNPSLLRVAELPPFAQAYAVNRAALALALESPSIPVTSPDWPPWTTQCLAFVPTDRVFGGEEGSSLISENSAQLSHRYRVTRREILTRAVNRLTFVAWRRARGHYISLPNYLRREFKAPAVRYLHQLSLRVGGIRRVPDWIVEAREAGD